MVHLRAHCNATPRSSKAGGGLSRLSYAWALLGAWSSGTATIQARRLVTKVPQSAKSTRSSGGGWVLGSHAGSSVGTDPGGASLKGAETSPPSRHISSSRGCGGEAIFVKEGCPQWLCGNAKRNRFALHQRHVDIHRSGRLLPAAHAPETCALRSAWKSGTMQQFDVAHLREQGVDLIIVFVNEQVRYMTAHDRNSLVAALTICARSAGLAGVVVLVWPGGFFGDHGVHAYFESVPYEFLVSNINKKLTCNNL